MYYPSIILQKFTQNECASPPQQLIHTFKNAIADAFRRFHSRNLVGLLIYHPSTISPKITPNQFANPPASVILVVFVTYTLMARVVVCYSSTLPHFENAIGHAFRRFSLRYFVRVAISHPSTIFPKFTPNACASRPQ